MKKNIEQNSLWTAASKALILHHMCVVVREKYFSLHGYTVYLGTGKKMFYNKQICSAKNIMQEAVLYEN